MQPKSNATTKREKDFPRDASNNTQNDNSPLLNLVPAIKRARDYYLYDEKGVRYTDLYQNNGLALLGHRPSKVSLALKNTMARGLWAEYPNLQARKIPAAIKKIFPSWENFALYKTRERALALLNTAPVDPLFCREWQDAQTVVWRPFGEFVVASEKHRFAFVLLPVVGGCEVQLVLSNEELPTSDFVSPVWIEVIKKTLFNLSVIQREEKTETFSSPTWKKSKCYFVFQGNKENYPSLFEKALKNRFLLPDSPQKPAILPLKIAEEEKKRILSFLSES